MARTIERENEVIEEIASEHDTQDEFILEDAAEFLDYMRSVYPDAVRRYVLDNWDELKEFVKETKLYEEC